MHSMAKDFFLVGSTMVSMVTIIAITIPGEASETPEVTEVRKTVGVARGWEVGHGEIDHLDGFHDTFVSLVSVISYSYIMYDRFKI